MELILWFRERSIFILIGIGIIYFILKGITRNGLSRKTIKYNKNAYKINRNKSKVFNEQHKNRVMEYSVDDSIKYGYRKNEVKRPVELKRKGNEFENMAVEGSKVSDKRYADALQRVVPISFLYDKGDFKNKTLRVYVEDVFGTVATLRDTSAIYELDLKGLYGIAGEFVLINIDKKGETVKVNYILSDF